MYMTEPRKDAIADDMIMAAAVGAIAYPTNAPAVAPRAIYHCAVAEPLGAGCSMRSASTMTVAIDQYMIIFAST